MFVTVKNIDADSLRYLRCMVKRPCKNTNFFQSRSRFLKKSLELSHSTAILADIKSVIGIDLDVAAIGGQEDVEDVVPVELGDAAPAVATHSGTLQLPVVVRIDAVDETAYFYCLCHFS